MTDALLGPDQVATVLLMVFLSALAMGLGTGLSRHVVADCVLIAQWMAQGVVLLATLRLPKTHRSRWRAEWMAELDAIRASTEVAPMIALLVYALPLVFQAGGLAQQLRPTPMSVPSPVSSRIQSTSFGTRARRRARRSRLRGYLGVAGLVATLLGVPGANLGWERLSQPISRVTTPEMGGVEGSEVMKDLLDEGSRLRRTSAP